MISVGAQQGSASQAKHPQYSVETVRLSSFTKWPTTSRQIPSVLCDAGFFYAGFSDCVRCFFCGGGLRNWEDGDIPWIEHARWSPNCDFLRQRKGELFIQMHRQDNNQHNQELPGTFYGRNSTEAAHDPSQYQVEHQTTEHENIEKTEQRKTAVRSVVEMGYPPSIVDACVEKLVEQGNTTYTATNIMELIFETEEQRNETQSDNQATQASGTATFQLETNRTSQPGNRSFDKEATKIPGIKEEMRNGLTQTASHITSTSVDCKSLVKENRDLKDQMICKICLDHEACMVYLPCGHMVTCQHCAPTIRTCCICRQLIQGTVKAYM